MLVKGELAVCECLNNEARIHYSCIQTPALLGLNVVNSIIINSYYLRNFLSERVEEE